MVAPTKNSGAPVASSNTASSDKADRPSIGWTIFFSLVFGIFTGIGGLIAGAIAASRHSRMAKARGFGVKRYWVAFVLSNLLPIAFLGLIIASLMSSGSSASGTPTVRPYTATEQSAATTPVQAPTGATPAQDVVQAEAKRYSAYATGNTAALSTYWASQNANESGYQSDLAAISSGLRMTTTINGTDFSQVQNLNPAQIDKLVTVTASTPTTITATFTVVSTITHAGNGFATGITPAATITHTYHLTNGQWEVTSQN